MGLKKLERRIRGWFPQEPSRVKAFETSTRAYKVFRYTVVFAILAFIAAMVILFYIPFLAESLVNRTVALTVVFIAMTGVVIYLTRARSDYKRQPDYHSTLNSLFYKKYRSRATFMICFGLASGFILSGLVVGILGQPLPIHYSLSLFFAFIAVGACIGDWVGKKRDYQFPLFP